MQDLLSMIAGLKRPRLLVRAARFGLDDYNRGSRLPRILAMTAAPRPGEAILKLLEIEHELDARRIANAADYTIARHVEVLIALMSEARILRTSQKPQLD